MLWKVVVPMVTSPICGFVVGFLFMGLLYFLLRNWRPATVNRVFGKLQLFSAAYMGFSHGTNDAQKTMGIIALALVAATTAGNFNDSARLAELPEIARAGQRPAARHRRLDQGGLRADDVRRHGGRAAGASSRRSATKWSSCTRSTVSRRKPPARRCCSAAASLRHAGLHHARHHHFHHGRRLRQGLQRPQADASSSASSGPGF